MIELITLNDGITPTAHPGGSAHFFEDGVSLYQEDGTYVTYPFAEIMCIRAAEGVEVAK